MFSYLEELDPVVDFFLPYVSLAILACLIFYLNINVNFSRLLKLLVDGCIGSLTFINESWENWDLYEIESSRSDLLLLPVSSDTLGATVLIGSLGRRHWNRIRSGRSFWGVTFEKVTKNSDVMILDGGKGGCWLNEIQRNRKPTANKKQVTQNCAACA